MNVIFLFPGQNSRYPGMFDRLLAADPGNCAILAEASETLGRDLRTHFRQDNPSQFALNRDVQIGVFLANHMHAASLRRRGVHADYSLGLSLGEYNHLVDIGALSFHDALRLLEKRGAAYEQAPEGVMTAVFPVTPEEATEAAQRASNVGTVAVAMFNTPSQCVLSGEREAVDAAATWLEEETACHSSRIESRLPMHSPMFRTVGDCFRPALSTVEWLRPSKPYLPNVLGGFLTNPGKEEIVECLWRHPWSPVYWRQSVESLAAPAENQFFVEVGPKSVLYDMGRRWIPAQRRLTDGEGDLAEWMDQLAVELNHGHRVSSVAC